MKTKGFTLIEILIASFIFMMVIVMATASFAMIKKSNELTTDISKTNECAKQTENYINMMVRSADFGSSRIVAIDFTDPNYSFVKIDNSVKEAVGFATFKKSDTPSRTNINAVVKKADSLNPSHYGYFSLSIEEVDLGDSQGIIDDTKLANAGATLTSAINDPANSKKIHSNGCAALDPAIAKPTGYDPKDKRFTVRGNKSYASGPSGQIGTHLYSVQLRDLFYNAAATQDQNKAMTRVFVNAVNNLRPI